MTKNKTKMTVPKKSLSESEKCFDGQELWVGSSHGEDGAGETEAGVLEGDKSLWSSPESCEGTN